jgi:hypothetical protein
MRALGAGLDREVTVAGIAGIVIGAVWLAWTGPGFVLAWAALIAGVVAWILRRRWVEVGTFMLATGLVPALGYRIFGPPEVPPRTGVPDAGFGRFDTVPVEQFAASAAELLVLVALVSLLVVTFIAARDTRHRARRLEAKDARRRAALDEGA